VGLLFETDTDYERLLADLEERLASEDAPVSVLVRREVERQVSGIMWFVAFAFVTWRWGWKGVVASLIVFFIYCAIDYHISRRRRGEERQTIVLDAEHLVRLQITAETYRRGEPCWTVVCKQYDADARKVVAADTPHWSAFWKRAYEAARTFQTLSPHERAKRLKSAARDAREPLENARELARRENATPPYWVNSALARLHR
jgi:hypothetical protein